jgi:hypothetical protein
MRNFMPRPLSGVVVLLACLASGALADQLTVANAGAYANMGGVYTSPYGIQVNGGSPVLMICDDFTTDIYVGYSWSGAATTLTDVSSTSVAGLKFANSPANVTPGIVGGTSNAAQDYAVAAVLAAELMSLQNIDTPSEDTETAGELSYAIWSLFDTNVLSSVNPDGSVNTGFGTLTSTEVSAAQTDIASALALVTGATTGGVTDLSKISIGGQSIESLTVYTANPASASQEFLMVSMPEPSYPAVLAVDLLAVIGLIAVFRRRLTGIFN